MVTRTYRKGSSLPENSDSSTSDSEVEININLRYEINVLCDFVEIETYEEITCPVQFAYQIGECRSRFLIDSQRGGHRVRGDGTIIVWVNLTVGFSSDDDSE